jgi:hypothetical protein
MADQESREVTLTTRTLGDGAIEVAVADIGSGISGDIAGRLFEPSGIYHSIRKQGKAKDCSAPAFGPRSIDRHGSKIEREIDSPSPIPSYLVETTERIVYVLDDDAAVLRSLGRLLSSANSSPSLSTIRTHF